MATVLILGAGVMGTALAVPAADNGHQVILAGTPLDGEIIGRLRTPGGIHPKLDEPLPASVEPVAVDDLAPDHFARADHVIVGVASPGIGWATDILRRHLNGRRAVAFVTKGLAADGSTCRTYAETIPEALPQLPREYFIGIGGPCIARELSRRWPTSSVYACADTARAQALADAMATPYYRLRVSDDVTGVEACAALKNFYAIGVSAMQTRFPDEAPGRGFAKNPVAALFNQAAREMALLASALGGRRDTAFDRAGLGDLHVTVGGGRNSKLGFALGRGSTVPAAMAGELAGETVEGIDTGRAIARWIEAGTETGRFSGADLPLAAAIIAAVTSDRPFEFDFATL